MDHSRRQARLQEFFSEHLWIRTGACSGNRSQAQGCQPFRSLVLQPRTPACHAIDLILRERLLAETYYFNMKNDGTKFSPLGLPYDVHLNPGDVLTKFFVELCKRRCSYHNIMRDLTHAWKKLSVLGYQRQVLMCAKLSTTCSECPVCSDMAIAVKST